MLILYLLNRDRFYSIGAQNLYDAVYNMGKYAFGKKYSVVDVLTKKIDDNPDKLFKPEATCISNVCTTGSIITRYFILRQGKERSTEKPMRRGAAGETPYRRIPIMMRQCRRSWKKPQNIWATRMYVAAVHPLPVLTVPDLSAGYIPTAGCITCHGLRHRGSMTSAPRFRRQTQRRGILSFSRVLTIRRGL